jgi:hypothetical protein
MRRTVKTLRGEPVGHRVALHEDVARAGQHQAVDGDARGPRAQRVRPFHVRPRAVACDVVAAHLEAFDDGERHPVDEGHAQQRGGDASQHAAGDLVAHLHAVGTAVPQGAHRPSRSHSGEQTLAKRLFSEPTTCMPPAGHGDAIAAAALPHQLRVHAVARHLGAEQGRTSARIGGNGSRTMKAIDSRTAAGCAWIPIPYVGTTHGIRF